MFGWKRKARLGRAWPRLRKTEAPAPAKAKIYRFSFQQRSAAAMGVRDRSGKEHVRCRVPGWARVPVGVAETAGASERAAVHEICAGETPAEEGDGGMTEAAFEGWCILELMGHRRLASDGYHTGARHPGARPPGFLGLGRGLNHKSLLQR